MKRPVPRLRGVLSPESEFKTAAISMAWRELDKTSLTIASTPQLSAIQEVDIQQRREEALRILEYLGTPRSTAIGRSDRYAQAHLRALRELKRSAA